MVFLLALLSTFTLPVPFVPQERDTCGAASLAMVFRYWEKPTRQEEIAATLLVARRAGSRSGSRGAGFACNGRGVRRSPSPPGAGGHVDRQRPLLTPEVRWVGSRGLLLISPARQSGAVAREFAVSGLLEAEPQAAAARQRLKA